MALADAIVADSSLAFDTDSLIYYVEEHPDYFPIVGPVFALVEAGRVRAHISSINLLEVLVRPLREGRPALATRYRELLTNPDDFVLHPVNVTIAERAAALRGEYRLGVADAIVASTALEAGCDYLITNNDDDFKNVRELRILVVRDFVTS